MAVCSGLTLKSEIKLLIAVTAGVPAISSTKECEQQDVMLFLQCDIETAVWTLQSQVFKLKDSLKLSFCKHNIKILIWQMC